MMKRTTFNLWAGLLSLSVAVPLNAQGDAEPVDEPNAAEEQAEQAEQAERQERAEQAERAIRELFNDFEPQGDDDPRQRLIEERDRLEELQRRLIEMQRDQQQPGNGLFDQVQEAVPVQLQPEPYTSPWSDRDRAEVIAALNDPAFAVRESAEAYLLTDNTLSQAVLADLLKQAQSPEQRQRLIRVAEHHVLRELRERDFGDANAAGGADAQDPRDPFAPNGLVRQRRPASIGYSYKPVLAHENPYVQLPGVAVIATMPGFPGHAYLRAGDIIVQIDGQGLSRRQQQHQITSWVRQRIAAHEAGDTIDFTILREGKAITLKMTCAQGLALDHMYTTDAFEAAARKAPYNKAWDQAREALTADLAQPKTLTPKPINPAE